MNITKICSRCQRDLPLSSFSLNKDKKDGHAHDCKECHNIYCKNHYNKRTKYYRVKATFRRKLYTTVVRTFLNTIKSYGCQVCGERSLNCLDFHHLDNKTKDENIARLVVTQPPLQTIINEVKKCSIVCANCHRKIHAKEIFPQLVLVTIDNEKNLLEQMTSQLKTKQKQNLHNYHTKELSCPTTART